jgi:ribonuclease P protein component
MIPLVSLKRAIDFSATLRFGKRFTHGRITAVVQFCSAANTEAPKAVGVGVSIRKKTAKKSTVRNRVKRLLRVSIRRALGEIEELGYFENGCAFERIVVFCNSAPQMPSLLRLDDVLPDVRSVLTAAVEYYQQRMNRHENNAHPPHSGI